MNRQDFHHGRRCGSTNGAKRDSTVQLSNGLYAGPNARRDAEGSERSRCIDVLGKMMINIVTSMGKSLEADDEQERSGPGCAQSETTSTVCFTATRSDCPYSSSTSWTSSELGPRSLVRGCLQNAHQAFKFLQETVGVPAIDRALLCHPDGTDVLGSSWQDSAPCWHLSNISSPVQLYPRTFVCARGEV